MAIARVQPLAVQVVTPAAELDQRGEQKPRAAASTTTAAPSTAGLLGAVASVAVTLAVIHWLSSNRWDAGDLDPSKLAAGISIFALFYAASQAIERLLEPLTMFVLPTADAAATRDTKVAEFQNAPTSANGKQAADAQALLDQKRANRTVWFWALATILGMAASGWLKLYFLRALGIESASRLAEILFTGLVIGGGTKPLHDLIARLEKANTNAQDPPETRSGK